MLKMCLSGCSFRALIWQSILFPEDAKYWMPGIIPFNKCVCDFYHIQAVCSVFVDMNKHQMVQSAVRTEVRFYPLHGRKWSLTDWQGEILPAQWLVAQVFVVALIDYSNSISSFTLSIVDSEKYLRVSSCAFNSRRWLPPWSHLYTTDGLHPRVPQSPLLVGNVKTIPIYFWIRSSLFVQ